MGTSDLNIGIGISAAADAVPTIERIRAAMVALRAELGRGSSTAEFAGARDALREELRLELDLVRQSVADKIASEDAGNRQRLAILERFTARARQLNGPELGSTLVGAPRNNAPVVPSAVSPPPGPNGPNGPNGPGGPNDPTNINVAIGRFIELGRVADVTNARALAGYRAQGDALAVNLAKLGATEAELNRIGTAITAFERRAGAAQVDPTQPLEPGRRRLIEFGNASDATFARVPRGARTAANAISAVAFAAQSGSGSMTGMVHAAGGLAFGLSQLSTSANIVAGAAGIGALVTIIATAIELFRAMNTEARQGEASLKSFNDSNESFAARSLAAGKTISELGGLPGSTASQIKLIGMTKAINDLRQAIVVAQNEASKNAPGVSFFQRLAASEGLTTLAHQQQVAFADDLKKLQAEFIKGGLTAGQFEARLSALGKASPQFATTIAASRQVIDNLKALEEQERKLAAAEDLRRAQEKETKTTFGLTPELTKNLDDTNKRLAALRAHGNDGVEALRREDATLESATKAWEVFATRANAGAEAHLTFKQALASSDPAIRAAAVSINRAARSIVDTDAAIANTPRILDARRQANAEIAVLEAERARGEVAAQREQIEQDFKARVDQINRDVSLESVRGELIGKARTTALAKLAKIDRDQAKASAAISASIATAVHEAGGDTSSVTTVDKATDEANKRRRERQVEIDKITVGDAEATANERNTLEEQAEDERNATIAAARREAGNALKKITADSEAEILKLTGDASAARKRVIQEEFDERAKAISKDGGGAQAQAINARRRDVELARVDLETFQTRGSDALRTLDTDLQRTQALATSGAISERQARDQVIAAYQRVRAELAVVLPQFERLARASNDKEAIRTVDELKTKFIDFGVTLHTLTDSFAKLKEAGKDATVNALAGILEGATKLGAQDLSQIRALKTDIAGAQQELNDLLTTPASQRTGTENQRISQLRGEISQTSQQLEQAKGSIKTWRDLFVDAAQSILDALIKVESQTLATQALEAAGRLLGGKKDVQPDVVSAGAAALGAAAAAVNTGGSQLGAASVSLQGAGATVVAGGRAVDSSAVALSAAGGVLRGAAAALEQAAAAIASATASTALRGLAGAVQSGTELAAAGLDFEFAEGGLTPNIGREGHDDIPARLTRFEFIQPPPAVRYYGVETMERMRRRQIPREWLTLGARALAPVTVRTPSAPYYNDGGLVSPAAVSRAGGHTTRSEHFLRVGMSPGLVAEEIKSPAGSRSVMDVLRDNANGVRGIL